MNPFPSRPVKVAPFVIILLCLATPDDFTCQGRASTVGGKVLKFPAELSWPKQYQSKVIKGLELVESSCFQLGISHLSVWDFPVEMLFFISLL